MDGLICQLEAGYRGMIQLYQELSNLAASVGKSLAAGDWKEVDALLAKKQGIMQVIDSREAELSRLREELQDRLGVEKFSLAHLPQSPAAAQLNDTLDELRDIIDELQARERLMRNSCASWYKPFRPSLGILAAAGRLPRPTPGRRT